MLSGTHVEMHVVTLVLLTKPAEAPGMGGAGFHPSGLAGKSSPGISRRSRLPFLCLYWEFPMFFSLPVLLPYRNAMH